MLKISNESVSDFGSINARGMLEQNPDFKKNFRVEGKVMVMGTTLSINVPRTKTSKMRQ